MKPEQYIGIKVVVAGIAGVGSRSFRVFGGISPHAEGADAEPDPGFCVANGLVDGLNEGIDLITPPVMYIRESFWVIGKQFLVGQNGSLFGVGVEVVIEVDAIYIVFTDDFFYDLVEVTDDQRIGWVEVIFVSVLKEPLLFAFWAEGAQGVGTRQAASI